MTKSDFMAVFSEKLNHAVGLTSNSNIEKAYNSFMETLVDILAKGEKLTLPHLGTFEVKDRPARKGHNPRTGEEMDIPECKIINFRASRDLKDRVNGKS